ncbi:unnamed protein product [Meloidogyne enterolobii]|uniref:Uncharacterized protein n=1 Tax=Meloidogyne enterolobii TaxID=390850 RepID=A0ACB0ZKT9_MELEN
MLLFSKLIAVKHLQKYNQLVEVCKIQCLCRWIKWQLISHLCLLHRNL